MRWNGLLVLAALCVGAGPAAGMIPGGPAPLSLTRLERITYRAHNGVLRPAWLLLPDGYRGQRIPLVISVHGRGESARSDAAGWGDLPGEGNFAVICPSGEGRRLRFYSWGDPAQIADLARMPVVAAAHGVRVDRRRVYAIGGSMGGQEVLLLLARHPHLLAGVVAFDPATSMARRYHDFAHLPGGKVLQRLARTEIGGTPFSDPAGYASRSPDSFARQIAFSDVAVQLYWSPTDRVIRDQVDESALLAARIFDWNPHAPLLVLRGDWHHSAEMLPFRRLPHALSRFGLLPWRIGFPDWKPHRTSGRYWQSSHVAQNG